MSKMIPRKINQPGFWLKSTLLIFGLTFMVTVLSNHYFFRTYALDYATYNFAFYDYAHFKISHCLLYEIWGDHKGTFLQDHFSFTLFYLVPFYWLLNWLTGSYTLLILQTAIILLSGYTLYRFIERRTNNEWLGLFSLLLYFILQGRYSAFTGDVNIGIISPCFIPFFLYYMDRENFVASSLIFILALFSRENMSIWFIFISIVQLFWYKKGSKAFLLCFVYLFSSALFFFLLFKVFIPAIEISEKKFTLFTFSALGKDPVAAIKFIFFHPVETFKLLFVNHSGEPANDGVKLEFYLAYLISGGFLLFLRPVYFIWLAPAIAFKMFNDLPIRWGIEWYYSMDVVTILPVSVALIVSEINLPVKFKKRLCAFTVLLALMVTIRKSDTGNHVFNWVGTTKSFIWKPTFFNPPYNEKKMHDDLKLIPSDASLSASESLLPHLAQRDSIYYFPSVGEARYLAFRKDKKDNYMSSEEDYKKAVEKYVKDSLWQVIVSDNTLVILKKKE